MDRMVYVVSDLHLGPGWLLDGELDRLEDFTADEQFVRFLKQIGPPGPPVELVIAGDFLEFCQTLPEIGLASPQDDLGSSEAESLRRARVILGSYEQSLTTGHRAVFEGLRRFMMEGHSITIIAGNHDIDLLWDGVWALLFDTIYPPGSCGDLRLVAYCHTIGQGPAGRVYIEHGHEYDRANRFGEMMSQPFGLDRFGVRRLKRCWGTLFVDKVFNQLEYERWFIDNVKPIMRVVQLGLRNDFLFTATAIGLVIRFLLTSGLPPLLGAFGAEVTGEAEDSDLALLPGMISDPDLQAAVAAQLKDPATRAELVRTLRGPEDLQLSMLLSGMATPLSFEPIEQPELVAGGEVLLGSGMAEDAYRMAARAVLEADPTISTVVMGHTHTAIDGYIDPLTLPDGRTGYYFNAGTWTQHLRDDGQRSYTWAEIGDPDNYTTLFSYVRLEPDAQGAYRATLCSWLADDCVSG